MSTVRTETIEYRGYELRLTEWCGSLQASVIPLSASLWQPSADPAKAGRWVAHVEKV